MAETPISRLHSMPDRTLDAMFENYNDPIPNHIEILAEDEDYVGLDTHQREVKRLRIRGYAADYLKSRPLRLQSSTLKGPLDGWKNPWATKRRAGLRTQIAKSSAVSATREDVDKAATREGNIVEDAESAVTDEQSGAERQLIAEARSSQMQMPDLLTMPSPVSDQERDSAPVPGTGEPPIDESHQRCGALESPKSPASTGEDSIVRTSFRQALLRTQIQESPKRKSSDMCGPKPSKRRRTRAELMSPINGESRQQRLSGGMRESTESVTGKRLCSGRVNATINRIERAGSVGSAGEEPGAATELVNDWLKRNHDPISSVHDPVPHNDTPHTLEADVAALQADAFTPSRAMPPPPTTATGGQRRADFWTFRNHSQPPTEATRPRSKRRRLSFNTTPSLKPPLNNMSTLPDDSPANNVGPEPDLQQQPIYDDFSTQAALFQAQASFNNILSPLQNPLRSPTPEGISHNGTGGSPPKSPSGLPAITPFRAFNTPPLDDDDDEQINTQALFNAARDFAFSTAKKPAPAKATRKISDAFRISKASSQPHSSPLKSAAAAAAKLGVRPHSQESETGTMDLDKALEDVSGFLDVFDLPEDILKGGSQESPDGRRTSGRVKRPSIKERERIEATTQAGLGSHTP